MNDVPFDPNAQRRADLEENIQETQRLIKEYEEKIRLGGDAKEIERCKKEKERLSGLLQGYQAEYAILTGGNRPTPDTAIMAFPETWLAGLPQPLAVAGAAYNSAADDTARFLALDALIKIAVKFLAAAALAQYRKDNARAPQLRPWLLHLSRHHLSEWATLLDEIAAHYTNQAEPPRVITALLDTYDRSLMPGTAMEILYHELGVRLEEGDVGKPAVDDFMRRLVLYRGRTWESGVAHLPPDFVAGLLPLLLPAVHEWLRDCALLRDYTLRYLETARPSAGGWQCELVDWRGPDAKPVRRTSTFADSHRERRLYLCTHKGQPLVNLHPLLIHYQDALYFLEAWGEDEELTFRPCLGGMPFPAPEGLRNSLCSILMEDMDGPDLEKIETQVERLERATEPPSPPSPALTLADLLARLSPVAHESLEIGLGEALRIGRFWLGVEFLLMGLSKQEDGLLFKILSLLEVDPGEFRGALRGMAGVAVKGNAWKRADVAVLGAEALSELQEADPAALAAQFGTDDLPKAVITPRMMAVLREATKLAGESHIEPGHLLLAALHHPRCLAVNWLLGLAVERGHDPRELETYVRQYLGEAALPASPGVSLGTPALAPRGLLGELGRDLTALAQAGKLRPAVGENAHQVMVQMGLVLLQSEANNPILLGDPGVGKTAIVEGFAYRLATDPKVVPPLAGKRIIDLSPGALLAGTKYRGELEQRLQQLLKEVAAARGGIIVFIDEIHTILGGRAEGGLGAISDMLKPALARGEFPCIGATTVAEYRRYIEPDPALARRFTPVWVEEPTPEEAVEIAARVAREHLSPHHGVAYPEEVVREAVALAVRYIHEEFLPGKAIKLLDQAGPRATLGGSLSGFAAAPREGLARGQVSVAMIRAIVSERTGVPLAQLSQSDQERLLALEETLKRRVQGQAEAVTQVARVVKRARTGLSDPRRPLGVFLFAGPTGVGKTELALALAEALFGEEDAIFRLDMSEYMEKHQVSRLIGAPPGYIGYEEEGRLTGRLRRRPYSVILLDEIEKAHEDVQHLFLQLFDAGRLTDSRGHLADGRNAIFIMTSNLGAKEALGFRGQQKPYREKMQTAIEAHFTPEFLNRVDRIVFFQPLNVDTLAAIFDKHFAAAVAPLRAQGIVVEVAPEVKAALVQQYLNDASGARPLQRAIEDELTAPLIDALLMGKIGHGMKVVVTGGGLQLEGNSQEVEPGAPKKAPEVIPELMDISVTFEAAAEIVRKRLQEQDLEIVFTPAAEVFLCDPFWNENRPLPQALAELVEQPLLAELHAGRFQPGDRVQVDKYADHLEFKKAEAV